MKVIDTLSLWRTPRQVNCPKGGFTSLRILLESDKMGFTMTETLVYSKVGPQHWHYKNHLEACYCVSGHGELIDESTGTIYQILPGKVYVLDKNDSHIFTAKSDIVKLICVFNPPLTGREVHRKDGSYERRK